MENVFRFDHESWCMIHCRPNSDIVQMTSNIADEELALMMAEAHRNRGGYVFGCMPAGHLIAAIELLKTNKGQSDKPSSGGS